MSKVTIYGPEEHWILGVRAAKQLLAMDVKFETVAFSYGEPMVCKTYAKRNKAGVSVWLFGPDE